MPFHLLIHSNVNKTTTFDSRISTMDSTTHQTVTSFCLSVVLNRKGFVLGHFGQTCCSSIFYYHLFLHSVSLAGVRVGCWRLSQLSAGRGGVTPWISHQLITGPHKKDKLAFSLALTLTDTLKFLVCLISMFLDSGRKSEYQRKPTHTERT